MRKTVSASLAVALSALLVVPTLQAEPTAPLFVVERQRAALVTRLAKQWADAFAVLPAERRLSHEQFSSTLWSLRADRLFAVSLAGDTEAVEAVLADARGETQRTRGAAKALGDPAADLTYTPLNPCRILDTRSTAAGPLVANTARTFDGFSANFSSQGGTATACGIPNGVSALALNVYAVNPTNLGFIKVWPANGAEPAVSTVNYQVGITAIATGALVPVDAGNSNRFIAKSPAGVHFVADAVGYFKPPGDAAGLDIKVAGQRVMRYERNTVSPNVIGGHPDNVVDVGVRGATIVGGGNAIGDSDPDFTIESPNRVTDHYGTVGGGYANQAGDGLGPLTDRAAATVAGGLGNTASGLGSTVGGGTNNTATGAWSTVPGGFANHATGDRGTVGGGENNTADGPYSTVVGGRVNDASGAYSLAAGVSANADGDRCFVFAGWSSLAPFGSRASCLGSGNVVRFMVDHGLSVDYFSARLDGGGTRWVYFGDNFAGRTINTWSGAHLTDAGVWVDASSSAATKADFAPVDSQHVLERVVALPVTTWRYKEGEAGVRHIGPMAEDFHAAFGVGYGPHTIADLDARGVALAAIQGVNKKLEEQLAVKGADIDSLKAEVAELRRAVEVLLARTTPEGREAERR